jgi:uncharacterized membrane protein
MKIFDREPTLWIAIINAAVILIGTLGLKFVSGDQAALIVVVINAIFAALNAYAVRPISPVVFTYAVGAIVALASSYGLNIPTETVAALNVLVITVLALIARGEVSPENTAISRSTGLADQVEPVTSGGINPGIQ